MSTQEIQPNNSFEDSNMITSSTRINLSIIIPYYNGENYIATCLDSLLDQDMKEDEYEIIVVDDGSTHSLDVLFSYIDKHQNIKYVKQKNARQSAARNKGLSNAQGEYVFFCDCDDYIVPNVIGKIFDIAIQQKSDVIFYNIIRQQEGEKPKSPIGDWKYKNYDSGMEYLNTCLQIIGGPYDFFAKRSFLVQHHLLFEEKMMMREDLQFYLEMLIEAGRVTTLNAQIYYYVQRPTSLVHLLGKVQQNSQFIDNIIDYIVFLSTSTLSLQQQGKVTEKYIQKINERKSEDAFIVLHNTFRFGNIKRNVKIVKKIKELDLYPIMNKPKYKNIIRFMNKPNLWLVLCVCYHLIPKSIRKNFV